MLPTVLPIANSTGDDILAELDITDPIEIGSGSQGNVYSGIWFGRSVAVKSCNSELWAEVEHLQRLQHENVVQLLGVGLWKSKMTLVLEYCSRGSLAKAARSVEHVCWILWIKWIREIANGMSYLHSQKIIHRDLKTDNILVTGDFVTRIADFGLSREKLLTKSSVMSGVVGTCCYMAPEMMKNDPCSNKVDVWSFGVVLWEMLSGQIPYNGLSAEQILFNVGSDNIYLFVPDVVPIEISNLLNRCWNREYQERPAFCDIMDAIDVIYAEVCITEEEWTSCRDSCREVFAVSKTYRSTASKSKGDHESQNVSCTSCLKVHPLNSSWCDLYDAVEANDLHGVRAYLSLPYAGKLLERSKGDYTPLKKATEQGYAEIGAELLHAGANTSVIGIEDLIGCASNSAALLRLLVDQGVNINMRGKIGKTALLFAAERGDAQAVMNIIECGGDLNITDKIENKSAIHFASANNHVAVVLLLLEIGIHVNRHSLFWTPLHYAAEGGAIDVVRLLIERGATRTPEPQILQTDILTRPPVDYAYENGHYEIVKLLVDAERDSSEAAPSCSLQ